MIKNINNPEAMQTSEFYGNKFLNTGTLAWMSPEVLTVDCADVALEDAFITFEHFITSYTKGKTQKGI